jgi:hypothetical protein
MCPTLIGFRDRIISLYSSKIVGKKEVLRTVPNKKAIPVTNRVKSHRVVRRRGSHIFSIDNRLTDGGKVVVLRAGRPLPPPPPNNIPGTHFC